MHNLFNLLALNVKTLVLIFEIYFYFFKGIFCYFYDIKMSVFII